MISASLVLYNNSENIYARSISSFLDGTLDGILVVIDNSQIALSCGLFKHPRVIYEHCGVNVGFGAGHNRAMRHVNSKYHLILNPDVEFDSHMLAHLSTVMDDNDDIGAVMPKIVYPDGSQQYLCKLLPTPFDLIFRRFIPKFLQSQDTQSRYELWDLPLDQLSDVPTLSGCFLLARTNLLTQVGGFDERFFMYLEDVDLVRRVGAMSRTVFVPQVEVVHHYAKGSYKSKRLLSYHVASAVRYFNKWGWLFDSERKERNIKALELLKKR